jgi:hypothetical protein
VSIDLLERGAAALGPLLGEVVFVGGATVTLWITDPAAPAPRPTKDVDVVVEVVTRAALHDFETRLRARGFAEDTSSTVICRWRFHDRADEDLILDAMPADATLMGFVNRWQGAALAYATERRLPTGVAIRAIPPPYLMAKKLEASSAQRCWPSRGSSTRSSGSCAPTRPVKRGRRRSCCRACARSPPGQVERVSTEPKVTGSNPLGC